MMKTQDEWYEEAYDTCYYSGILGFIWGIVHKTMEWRYRKRQDLLKVIEVGAGHGQHFKFVRHGFDTYLATDVREKLIHKIADPRFRSEYADATKLENITSDSFDRLVAT